MLRKLLTFLTVLAVLNSCSGLSESDEERSRRLSKKGEFIYRLHDQYLFDPELPPPQHQIREKYIWEEGFVGNHLKISKEYLRCKGSRLNPVHVISIQGKDPERLFDCGGPERHSLPLRDGEEFIYPILLDLLNYVQAKTGERVVVTSGHRCPTHNAYADPSRENQASKHQIGAEVDFYVQGKEEHPDAIIAFLIRYFKDTASYDGHKEYTEFLRYDKGGSGVSIAPWYNKEIFIKLFKKDEGRNVDNRHPYPYINLQVRFDRDRQQRVTYTPEQANNFLRK